MEPTLVALKTLLVSEGPDRLWLGYSVEHGWVVLDRALKPNQPGIRSSQLILTKLDDLAEVGLAREDWDAMTGLTYYGRRIIANPELSYLIDRVRTWHQTSEERGRRRRERQKEEERARQAALQAKTVELYIERIRTTPYHKRDRADAIALLRNDLKEQQVAERGAIEGLVEERKIHSLVHFTSIRNLRSILTHGLLSRRRLESRGLEFRYNDTVRWDGLQETTSLSIEFPNYRMFYKYKVNQAEGDVFCLLALHPRVLWELPCLFSPENAAKHRLSPNMEWLKRYTGVHALARMFEGGEVHRERYKIPLAYTTNSQAEVLVVDDIPTNYIKGVALQRSRNFQHRAEFLELAAAYGVADFSETHSHWFLKRPDDDARWKSANQPSDIDIF